MAKTKYFMILIYFSSDTHTHAHSHTRKSPATLFPIKITDDFHGNIVPATDEYIRL